MKRRIAPFRGPRGNPGASPEENQGSPEALGAHPWAMPPFDPQEMDAPAPEVPQLSGVDLNALVDEKTWASAYVRNKAPRLSGALQLDSGAALRLLENVNAGRLSMRSSGGTVRLLEWLLVVWTVVLLLGFLPLQRHSAIAMAGGWLAALVLCGTLLQSRLAARILTWTGGTVSTLAWLYFASFLRM